MRLANAYIDDQLEAKFDAARRAGTWLQARLNDCGSKLQTAKAPSLRSRIRTTWSMLAAERSMSSNLPSLIANSWLRSQQTSEARAKLDRVQSVLHKQ